MLKRSLTRLLALCVMAFAIQCSFCFGQTNTKPARPTARPAKPETPHLKFVTEYIRLKSMRLNKPFDFLIPTITAFYEQKIELWRRIHEISSAFIGGPKDGVDYGKLGAEMPEIRGNLDFIDQSLFEAAPSIFATLIDVKEDSKGHASHLIITKEEKAGLVSKLEDSFGAKLDQKDQNYTISAAKVLRDYLNKDFKCADESWD